MKRFIAIAVVLIMPILLSAQDPAGAVLKITNIHVTLNGEEVDYDETYEVRLESGIPVQVTIFDRKDFSYGTTFTYKKGKNRLKLVRRGFAFKAGSEPRYGKQKKDMQEIKASIPGSLSMRVVDNIVLDRETLESINVSFNYELMYK